MIFDPSDPNIEYSLFERKDWQHSVYATEDCDLKEVMPQAKWPGDC